jgi:CrcB protein
MLHLALVALGGAIGSGFRHLVNLAALRLVGPNYPAGTLTVNQGLRLFLATGILGGFTTFSAFSLDAVLLWERGDLVAAALYVALSVFLSIAALMLGLMLMRAVA